MSIILSNNESLSSARPTEVTPQSKMSIQVVGLHKKRTNIMRRGEGALLWSTILILQP